MRRIASLILRVAAVLCAALGCAWGAGVYSDERAFEMRNADVLALCSEFVPGMPEHEAERRAYANTSATVAEFDGDLVVKVGRQRPCLVEFAAGTVHSAAVPRFN